MKYVTFTGSAELRGSLYRLSDHYSIITLKPLSVDKLEVSTKRTPMRCATFGIFIGAKYKDVSVDRNSEFLVQRIRAHQYGHGDGELFLFCAPNTDIFFRRIYREVMYEGQIVLRTDVHKKVTQPYVVCTVHSYVVPVVRVYWSSDNCFYLSPIASRKCGVNAAIVLIPSSLEDEIMIDVPIGREVVYEDLTFRFTGGDVHARILNTARNAGSICDSMKRGFDKRGRRDWYGSVSEGC